MNTLISLAVLLLIGSAASAATVEYALQQVTYTNSFLGSQQQIITNDTNVSPRDPGACQTCYGTTEGTGDPATAAKAFVDTLTGDVSVTGAGWQGGPMEGTEYNVLWDLVTSIGGTEVTKTSQSCTDISGAFCADTIAGYGRVVLATGTDPNGRDAVTVIDDGSTLTISIQRAPSQSTTSVFSQA